MQVDTADKNLLTKEELENKIATLTGGRAAEEVAFGQITTGASNDIEQATKLARAMITRYGMNDDFDMVAFETVNNQYLTGHLGQLGRHPQDRPQGPPWPRPSARQGKAPLETSQRRPEAAHPASVHHLPAGSSAPLRIATLPAASPPKEGAAALEGCRPAWHQPVHLASVPDRAGGITCLAPTALPHCRSTGAAVNAGIWRQR